MAIFKNDKGESIEVKVGRTQRRSPFEMKNFGIKEDPTKDRRWVDPKRIDERKGDGYQFIKNASAEGAIKEDGTVRTKGRMVAMERPREMAEESARQKQIITRERTRAVKDSLSEDLESLSSKHGIDLHKLFGKLPEHED